MAFTELGRCGEEILTERVLPHSALCHLIPVHPAGRAETAPLMSEPEARTESWVLSPSVCLLCETEQRLGSIRDKFNMVTLNAFYPDDD